MFFFSQEFFFIFGSGVLIILNAIMQKYLSGFGDALVSLFILPTNYLNIHVFLPLSDANGKMQNQTETRI